ncbi:putative uncharacterized protein DDB_G0293878 [Melanaphis sacchari]|uniref:putative uncharacterized protein DDB_G0293878 n=1 Tax=Melanaphis sacchari TaxID=742174 RepID=UPI000DC130AF|nr:putative uncharacterized protein DDB_G0293878 [Melanaphis sacchari]
MAQNTIQNQLLYKSSSSNPDKNVEQNRSSHQSVYNSTSSLKRELNGRNELNTKNHKKIISAEMLLQYSKEITNKKEFMNNKKIRKFTQQDLEILKIFTSPEWSKKSFYTFTKSIVNSMVNDDNIPLNTESENILDKTYKNEAEVIEYLDNIQEITDQDTEETDYVEEKRYLPNESFNSVQIFEEEEKELENHQENITESMVENQIGRESFEVSSFNSKTQHELNMSFETNNDIANDFGSRLSRTISNVDELNKSLKVDIDNFTYNKENVNENQSGNEHEFECCSYKEYFEEQEVSLNINSVVSTSNLSAKEVWNDVAFMQNFNFDDFSDSYGSEIVDSSPTGSLNTDAMTRIIRQNKSRNYMTEKQMSNESAYKEAMELILEETKVSLGQLLIEGLYFVSKRHRQDSFKCLGKWLLIQADIRDENKTEEESVLSFEK